MDGTLVLSNDAHAESWVRAFQKFGFEASHDHIRALIGMGGDKLVRAVDTSLDNEKGIGKQISDYRKELFEKEYVENLRPAPGSRKLVERLQGAGYKTVVASSASEQEIEKLLIAAEVNDLLPLTTTSDDAEESKPDPDIVHAALKKAGLPANEVVMIGDTPYDVEAATKAGVRVIAVRCGGWNDADLVGAIAVYDNPAALLNCFDVHF